MEHGIKEFLLHDDLQAKLATILDKLPKGSYTGTATDLHNDIVAISTGVQGVGATTSNSPTGTGVASWLFAGGGTYTNYGGLVIPANYVGFIIRSDSDTFSYVGFELDLSLYAKKQDVVFKSELIIGKNKINKDRFIDGKYVDENGNIGSYPDHCYSEYIELKPNFHYISNELLRFVTLYDEYKQVIPGGFIFVTQFLMPENAKYAVISFTPSIKKNTAQLEEGSVVTGYESYRNAITPYSNRIACPKKQHFLSTIENNIYLDEFQKRKLPTTLMKIDAWPVAYRKNDFIRAVNPAVGTYSINSALVDLDYIDVQRKNFTIIVNDLSKTTPVKVISVGDSYTDIGGYVKKMGQTIPNVIHLGTCKTASGTDVNREGRSGWKLTHYLRNINSIGNSNVFSPFIHPIDPYKYYGNTAFWQKCYIGTAPSYEIDAWIPWVTTLNINSSGVRATPNVNDVMWFTNDNAYKVWNGTAWTVISENTLNFTFNFAKYLNTWNVETPDIVTTLLGMNDFRSENLSTFDTFFDAWKADMDFFISKIKEAVPAIKIVICTCNSTEYNEADGYSNAAIWAGYEKVIEAYDDRESEQIYISDTKAAVDRVWGYGGAFEKPFSLYAASNTVWTTGGDVHLLDHGMAQIGQKLAATIQHIRP